MQIELRRTWTGRDGNGKPKTYWAGMYGVEQIGKENADMLVRDGVAEWVHQIEKKSPGRPRTEK